MISKETNDRLLAEVRTLAGLLKMKIRVENGSKETYSKLTVCIDRLIQLEEKANEQLNYYSELEVEVISLRKTCDKFTELSDSIQLLNSKYKQQIAQLSSEKQKLSEEMIDIR